MHIDIVTLFPDMFTGYLQESILKRAQEAGLVSYHLHHLREYGVGRRHITDEPPFGGGGGMVLKPEPVFTAVETILGGQTGIPIILTSPQGRPFTQSIAQELAAQPRLLLLCGRYEGFDERIRQHLVTDELSIGDYVLTGGELAAMVIVDAVTRLLPGALGADGAAETDSYATGLLEGPHYTKPVQFRDWAVPELLRSGHGGHIARWRRQEALRRTWQRRPDLLLTAELTEEDKWFLAELAGEDSGAMRDA
jgi:tRNA (guanine37-N1)-methyltransferase